MEKYDNIVKSSEIRKLTEKKMYQKALHILDGMDISKIKVLTDLSVFAEVYIQTQRYEDARKVLLRMREKSNSRRVVYQLIKLSIKTKEAEEAEKYYKEYVTIAPRDTEKFILRYRIDKMKGEPIESLIKTLEQLKEYDYIEKWSYELAKLYHKAGRKDQCIRECSDIILWFGDGIIVEKARMLKEYYEGNVTCFDKTAVEPKKEQEETSSLIKTKDLTEITNEVKAILEAQLEPQLELQIEGEMGQGENLDDTKRVMEKTKVLGEVDVLEEVEAMEEAEILEETEAMEEAEILEETEAMEEAEILEETEAMEEAETLEETEAMEEAETLEETETMEEAKTMEDAEILEEAETMEDGEDRSQRIVDQPAVKEALGCFASMPGIALQIAQLLEKTVETGTLSCFGIEGYSGYGKTTLAKALVKVLLGLGMFPEFRLAKITSTKLNRMDLPMVFPKIQKCFLIIEEPLKLESKTVEQLVDMLELASGEVVLVLEGMRGEITSFVGKHELLGSKLSSIVTIEPYTREDLLELARHYFMEKELQMEEEAEVCLEIVCNQIANNVHAPQRLQSLRKKLDTIVDRVEQRYLEAVLAGNQENRIIENKIVSSDF